MPLTLAPFWIVMLYYARRPVEAGFSPPHTNSKLPDNLLAVNSSSGVAPRISLERMFSPLSQDQMQLPDLACESLANV